MEQRVGMGVVAKRETIHTRNRHPAIHLEVNHFTELSEGLFFSYFINCGHLEDLRLDRKIILN
jgi:hypothetical protein